MTLSAAYVFGSAARGDSDAASDTDVLLVYAAEPAPEVRVRARASVSRAMKRECSFAEYSSRRLSEMFDDGHLFAWHLHHEATPVHLPNWSGGSPTLPRPAPYRSACADAENFLGLLRSSLHTVRHQASSVTFEAGLAYVALRNIGMSLSGAVLDRPRFDRWVPFRVADALSTTPPCRVEAYDLLVAARHASQRGLPAPDLARAPLEALLHDACDWAQHALEAVREQSLT